MFLFGLSGSAVVVATLLLIAGCSSRAVAVPAEEIPDTGGVAPAPDDAAGPRTPDASVVKDIEFPSCVRPFGLVSWWPGEGNPSDAVDGNTGTLKGTTFAPGQMGRAFSFDGVDDHMYVGNPSNLQFGTTADFTVSAWVRFTALVSPPDSPSGPCFGPGCDMTVVNKMGAPVNGDGWRLFKQSDDHLWFCLGVPNNGCVSGVPTTVQSTTVATPGIWYLVVAVRSSSQIAIYVNGVLEESKPLPYYVNTDSAALVVGSYPMELALVYGRIDEIEIYNRALTDAEIQSVFNAGMGRCTSD